MADCKVNYSPTNYLTQEPVSVWNGQTSEQYSGNITWSFAATGAPIPDGGTYTANKFQWLHSSYEKTITVAAGVLGIDDRSRDFNNVQYKFDLTAGTYKLIFEAIDPTGTWNSDRLSRYSSSSGYYGTPDFGLYTSSGSVMSPISFDKTKYQGKTFIHEEYEFTLSSDRRVGLWFRGMGHADSTINGFMPRFMIVPTNTIAKKFDVTSDNVTYSGYSCWSGLYHSLRKLTTATEAVENPLYSDGTAITAYTIKGNEEHTGTPTPSNPVEANGVGVRTENLWNEDYTGISDELTYRAIYVGDGQFTMSTNASQTSEYAAILFILEGNVSSGASTVTNGVWDGHTRTVTSIDGYVTIAYRTVRTYTPVGSQTMLNSGSTDKPYEPYGYKIPISNGGVTTNIYLGNVQSTRPIREIAFKGTESWVKSRNDANDYLYHIDIGATYAGAIADIISTHLPFLNRIPNADEQGCTLRTYQDNYRIIYINFGSAIMNAQTSGNTVQGLKEYLAAQNTNGTPFTVWHTLLSPTTATVNKPLMKIGDYADSISNATSIPTTEGANSIIVGTTVQPSEFTATWTGWHNASVKEKSENLLDVPYFIANMETNPLNANNKVLEYTLKPNTYYTLTSNFYLNYNACWFICLPDTAPASNINGVNVNNLVRTVQTGSDGKLWIWGRTVATPEGAKPIDEMGDSDWVMLNEGQTALSHEPYWK